MPARAAPDGFSRKWGGRVVPKHGVAKSAVHLVEQVERRHRESRISPEQGLHRAAVSFDGCDALARFALGTVDWSAEAQDRAERVDGVFRAESGNRFEEEFPPQSRIEEELPDIVQHGASRVRRAHGSPCSLGRC